MMGDIIHDPGLREVFADMCLLEDADFEAKYYTSGIAAPRYPVPAIPLQVKERDE